MFDVTAQENNKTVVTTPLPRPNINLILILFLSVSPIVEIFK